ACCKKLVKYESDASTDKTYPGYCYRHAIGRPHEDAKTHGSALDDITRAVESAILGYTKGHGGPPGPNYIIPAQKGPRGPHNHPENFFQRVANAIGPGNATSIPLALLILAGVGLPLGAAAAASYGARRIRARRGPPQPATVPPTPRRK